MTHFHTRSLVLSMGLTLAVAAHAQMTQPLSPLTPPAVLAADATKLTIAADYKADKVADAKHDAAVDKRKAAYDVAKKSVTR